MRNNNNDSGGLDRELTFLCLFLLCFFEPPPRGQVLTEGGVLLYPGMAKPDTRV